MNETNNKRAIMVGIFIFLGLLFLVTGILMIGKIQNVFTSKIKVHTVFEDVSGLQAGDNIWFSGVKVGNVKKVAFYGQSQVRIVMDINEDVQKYIRTDAKVKVSTDGLIGHKILIIYGGTEQANIVNEDDTLLAEKTLSTEDMMNTLQKSNQNIQEITNDLKLVTRNIVTGKGTVGKLLSENGLYNELEATMGSLRRASGNAQTLTASLSNYTSKLNNKGTLANDLVTDTIVFNSIKATVQELQTISDSASAMVTDLKQASKNPNSTIGVLLRDDKTGANVKDLMKNLEESSKKLDQDLDALKYSFLLRGAFKRKKKAEQKSDSLK